MIELVVDRTFERVVDRVAGVRVSLGCRMRASLVVIDAERFAATLGAGGTEFLEPSAADVIHNTLPTAMNDLGMGVVDLVESGSMVAPAIIAAINAQFQPVGLAVAEGAELAFRLSSDDIAAVDAVAARIGERLIHQQQSDPIAPIQCACGATIGPSAKFCSECGRRAGA